MIVDAMTCGDNKNRIVSEINKNKITIYAKDFSVNVVYSFAMWQYTGAE